MGFSMREEVWRVMMAIISFVLLLLLGFHGETSEGCLREEREALMILKEAFNYPNGHSLPSWNNHTITTSNLSDCCTWESIECDNSTHRVIKIDLSYERGEELRHIKWSLNASYFLPFQHLQYLYLEGNYLSGLFGPIRLPNLEKLYLSNNKLTQFPSFDLSSSLNLEILRLDANSLKGSIPEHVTSLTSLTFLTLSFNNLTGSLPQQGGLCNLKNLVLLDLASNEFEGQLPLCLSTLTSLYGLYIANNRFERTFPSLVFHALTSLKVISFSDDNYFSGTFSLSLLANHSNLKTMYISCSKSNLKLETENPPFIPSFQLTELIIINCTLNEANNNKIPTFLLHQYHLQIINLSHLNIRGTFPYWLLTNNTQLFSFNLTHNLFTAPFQISPTSKFLQMQSFDISFNPIRDKMPFHIGFIFPNLIFLYMSSASLQGCLPASINQMTQLNVLDLSNNNLSGSFAQKFGYGGTNDMRLPNSSNNTFKGKSSQGVVVVINSSQLRMLDLSANRLFGEIPDWFGNFHNLTCLILSKNSFTGSLPKSFCNLSELVYLDLSQNQFNGSLPRCLNLPLLKHLFLRSNHFMGPLPSTLSSSPLLLTLDLMENNFSGGIPRLFSSFLNLRVLILKENKLGGPIPTYLCELKKISMLDLSQNKLSGGIPYCLNNITFGKIDAQWETNIGSFIVSWPARFS